MLRGFGSFLSWEERK